jgi:beta-phosphoglucomutase-like phosphatase (HAD superfamily)
MLDNAKAFIFDLNGTMINDMPYHIGAWHQQLAALGSSLSVEEVKHQCYGKNDELLERVFPGRFSMQEKLSIGANKEALYRLEFKPHLKLIEGLALFLKKAFDKNIKMGIGSAAITLNIDFVLDNTQSRNYFDVIVSADDVLISKPHPETFLKCAELLGMAPSDCIVFEDTPKGVLCAQKAGMKTIVIKGMHQESEFADFDNILFFIEDYTHLSI